MFVARNAALSKTENEEANRAAFFVLIQSRWYRSSLLLSILEMLGRDELNHVEAIATLRHGSRVDVLQLLLERLVDVDTLSGKLLHGDGFDAGDGGDLLLDLLGLLGLLALSGGREG